MVGPHLRVDPGAADAVGADRRERPAQRVGRAGVVAPRDELELGRVAGRLLGVQARHQHGGGRRRDEQHAGALVVVRREAQDVPEVVGRSERDEVEPGLAHAAPKTCESLPACRRVDQLSPSSIEARRLYNVDGADAFGSRLAVSGVEAVDGRCLPCRDQAVSQIGEHQVARAATRIAVPAAVRGVDADQVALVQLEGRRDRVLLPACRRGGSALDVVARAFATAVDRPRSVDAARVRACEEEAVGACAVVEHDALAAALLAGSALGAAQASCSTHRP